MARKIKIYLDTSVISAKFDDRNPDRKELTENFFVIIDQYDPYISRITIAEIENTPDATLKSKMQECVKGFNVLDISEAIENLAQQYVKGGAVPKKYQEDAYHIAFAVINEIDYLLSWNFKHVVKQKTRAIVKMVNTINRYRNLDIITGALHIAIPPAKSTTSTSASPFHRGKNISTFSYTGWQQRGRMFTRHLGEGAGRDAEGDGINPIRPRILPCPEQNRRSPHEVHSPRVQ